MPGFQPLADLTDARLLSLFERGDFSFSMRGWKGDVADFFAPTSEHDQILAERRDCLQDNLERYCGALDSLAADSLAETAALAATWQSTATPIAQRPVPLETCRALALALEPDFLLLTADETGAFSTVAGAICFPSSWEFSKTLGKPLAAIHSVVPGLNDALRERIDALLAKLSPAESWARLNWGLSLFPDRNQHPARHLPRLAGACKVDRAWLRIEIQVLHKLPATRAILFGIRPLSIPLDLLESHAPGSAPALRRQLTTMPPELLDYKGIGQNAHLLDRWLR